MQLLAVTALPIYLPADKAPVPFGDPLSDATITLASPGVFTVPGYAPTVGDAISFSIPVPIPPAAAGTLPVAVTVGTVYYVQALSGAAGGFNISATKGGAAINTATASTGVITAHLLSGETYGVTLPFKPGNTVLVENNSGGTLVLQGAPDVNVNGTWGSYGNPGGPGTFVTLATLVAGQQALVNLSQDWIRLSSAGTLWLIQN